MTRKAALVQLHKELGDLINAYEEPEVTNELSSQQADFITRTEMIAKAKAISDKLLNPVDLAFTYTAQLTELVVLRVAQSISLLAHIPEPPATISLSELAKATKLQPALMARILRYLAGSGFLAQSPSDPTQFSHTSRSLGWQQSDVGLWYEFIYDGVFQSTREVHLFFQDDSMRPHYEPGSEPSDCAYCPATYANGVNGTNVWQWMYSNPKIANMARKAFTVVDEGANQIVGAYDWNRLSESPNNAEDERLWLVDVGGGLGQSTRQILDAFPGLATRPEKFMMQDLPSTIEASKTAKILPDTSPRLAHDFMTPQPAEARGAKAYLLRRIIHDWSDEVSIVILKNIADAMSSESVVLVSDAVIPEVVKEKDMPLLANDWLVISLGGKERTQKEFEGLFAKAGLELVKVWRHAEDSGAGAVVEGRLKR